MSRELHAHRVRTCFGQGGVALVTLARCYQRHSIADAMMDSTPLVVISGQVNSNLLGSDAFQRPM